MQGRCEKHLFDPAEDRCGTCGAEFCAECLVYAFGPKRPPFCIPCAVAAAGIRRTAACGALSRRDAKRLERERRGALKEARKAEAAAVKAGAAAREDTDEPAPETETVPYELPQPAALDVPEFVPAAFSQPSAAAFSDVAGESLSAFASRKTVSG